MSFEWDIGIATKTTIDADGFMTVQVDRFGGTDQGGSPMEVHFPLGMVAYPLDPDVDASGQPTNGCSFLFATEGDKLHAFPLSDPRVVALLPIGQPGETYFYGSKGQFIRFHADASISIYTTDDGTPNGRTISLMLSPQEGLVYTSPWFSAKMGPDGGHLRHSGGARLDMGSIGGMPAPLDQLGSYLKIQAAMVSIKGSAVSIGTDGGAANLAASTAISTFLTALVAAIATITTASPGASAMATITPLLGPLTLALQNLGKTV